METIAVSAKRRLYCVIDNIYHLSHILPLEYKGTFGPINAGWCRLKQWICGTHRGEVWKVTVILNLVACRILLTL